mgnify:CR=1 FL=1
MNPGANLSYLLPPLLAAMFSGFLGYTVAKRARRSPPHFYFSLFLLSIGLSAFLIFLMRASPDTQYALFWERVLIPVMLLSSPTFYFFTLAYTRRQPGTVATVLLLVYITTIVFLMRTGLLVERIEVAHYGYAPIFGRPFYPLMLSAYAWVVSGMFVVYQAYHASKVYQERNRLLYIIVATVFPIAGSALDILPSVYPATIMGYLAFGALTTVAIGKHHLLDIPLAVRRGLAYLTLSALAAAPFLTIAYLNIIGFHTGRFPAAVYLLLLIGLALAIVPIWRLAQRAVDWLFFRHRWSYLHALEEFSRRTSTVTNLEKLASDVVELVGAPFQVDGVSLLLPSEEGTFRAVAATGKEGLAGLSLGKLNPVVLYLEKGGGPLERHRLDFIPQLLALADQDRAMLEASGGELFLPLRRREQLSGILALGAKLGGGPYTQEELRLLTMIATQTAVVLDDARLFASQKALLGQLQELDQVKSHFFFTLAHHLKTPVTAIKASAEMLGDIGDGDQTPVRKQLLSAMLRSTKTLENTVSGVLELVRIRSAAVEVEPEPTDVRQLLQQVVAMLEPAIRGKEQVLELRLPSAFPQAQLDQRRFEQIMMNLLENAHKFTPPKGRLAVTLKQSNGYLIVEVSDSGPGIPEDDQAHVFEPFYQGKNSVSTPGSTGLGLAIARSLVEFLGGQVWLKSKVGEGSTLAFSLPLIMTPGHPATGAPSLGTGSAT